MVGLRSPSAQAVRTEVGSDVPGTGHRDIEVAIDVRKGTLGAAVWRLSESSAFVVYGSRRRPLLPKMIPADEAKRHPQYRPAVVNRGAVV